MKNIANTKHGSEHNQALAYMKKHKRIAFTPREVEHSLGIWYPNLARRFREDYHKGILFKRINEGHVEYKWRSQRRFCGI